MSCEEFLIDYFAYKNANASLPILFREVASKVIVE